MGESISEITSERHQVLEDLDKIRELIDDVNRIKYND